MGEVEGEKEGDVDVHLVMVMMIRRGVVWARA